MTDRYQSFTDSPIGKIFVKNLGLPNPMKLDRWHDGAPLVDGTVLIGGSGRLADSTTEALGTLGVGFQRATETPSTEGDKLKGLVFDATGLTTAGDLIALQSFFTPLMRRLQSCARVVVLGHQSERDRIRLRTHRPTSPRGIHPVAWQGDRQGQHGQSRVRLPRR
ncbi:MAG: hypothetical protein V9G13_14060 [Marmoricola sp.]